MNRIVALIVGVVALLLVVSSTVFVVGPQHVAVVVPGAMSAHKGQTPVFAGPGLHVKLPPPLARIDALIDTRAQTSMLPGVSHYASCTSADKATLLVSPLIRYRVSDPARLYAATQGDVATLPGRVAALARDVLADVFARHTASDALAQQPALAQATRDALKTAAAPLGVEVLDVTFARIDYPAAQTAMLYGQMRAALVQIAASERAQGALDAQRIRDDAARAQQQTLSQAYSQAQEIRGDGDSQAAAIAAQAFGRDPQFYRFYQSMQAYRNSFKPGDVLVVDASGEFFRFMHDASGQGPGVQLDASSGAPGAAAGFTRSARASHAASARHAVRSARRGKRPQR